MKSAINILLSKCEVWIRGVHMSVGKKKSLVWELRLKKKKKQ